MRDGCFIMKIQAKMPCPTTGSSWRCAKSSRPASKFSRQLAKALQYHCEGPVWILVVVVMVISITLLLIITGFGRDECNGQKIKDALCKDYNDGLIAGDLCYSICIEESLPLDHCFSQTDKVIVYQYESSLVQLQRYPSHTQLPNPVSMETFEKKVSELIDSRIYQSESADLLKKVVEFADMNQDGDLNYAECNSMWQLMNNQEFFMLFIFQHESSFPQINGTCGSAYAFDYVSTSPLYTKKADSNAVLQYFFPNYNQWLLPSWEKRALVAVGLLEFSSVLMESYSTRFYLCDIQHTDFAVSQEYEAKVVKLSSMFSEKQLQNLGKNRHCFFDSECFYGHGCNLACDVNSRTCSNVPRRPPISFVCDILKDYILYDSPEEFRYRIEAFISQCQTLTSWNLTIYQNVIPDKIKSIFWNEVKNKPVDWLNPKKSRKKRDKQQ